MANKVRIVAGKIRGRNITFPDNSELRPTLGRVKESMFAWIDQDIVGAKCLDLFAGSGALGFEAYSRGASLVVMFENNKNVAQSLQRNLMAIGADSVISILGDYTLALDYSLEKGPFDIVFLDPPYGKYDLYDLLSWLSDNDIIAKDGLCLCEWHLHLDFKSHIMYKFKKLNSAGNVNFALLVHDKLGK